jgi:hypothetical protein
VAEMRSEMKVGDKVQTSLNKKLLKTSTEKTKVLGFVGADHLRTKIIINDETL